MYGINIDELIKAIETKNWELKINPAGGGFYLEVVDPKKCTTILQQWMLRQSGDVWQGKKALFFRIREDADVFGELVFKLHEKFGLDLIKYLHWVS